MPAHHPTPDDILASLDPEQREVATSLGGPVCVLAGAGTGKTRAITHRIAYAVHSGAAVPQRTLAVTFTARAAGEMRARLRQLGVVGVPARTFHAAALKQLHYFWPQAVGGPAPEVQAVKAPLMAEAAMRLRLQVSGPAIRDFASEVEWAKVNLLTPGTYPAAARAAGRQAPGVDLTAMARLFEAYEEAKGARGVMDFEDVLLLLVGILRDREDIARTVRSQYRHFVVDEYQDVNTVQQTLLGLWLGERDDLCVVGDPSQTIYSFTGASPAHLLGFTQRFPAAQTVRLVRNYRSTPQIVGLANSVIAAARPASDSKRPTSPPLQLIAQLAGGPEPLLSSYDDDASEAEAGATQIAARIGAGTPPADIAVLFRTNGQSEAIESALSSADVPYLVRGGERFFARQEIRQAIMLLRGAARSDDGSKTLGEITRDVIAGAGWAVEPPQGGAARERWESLNALAALADDLQTHNAAAHLPELIGELDRRATEQHAPAVQGVTLASLHAAKGLEWPEVFLIGASEGLIPISLADTPEAVEEERRLLYVGVTRARQRLTISYAKARVAGQRANRSPSRFLASAAAILGPAAAGSSASRGGGQRTARPPKVATPAHCRVCRQELTTAAQRKVGRCDDCPPTYDEATFGRLKDWRREEAREASVPAYVVFTDATLTAIAEREPDSLAALAQISGVGARKLGLYGAAVLAILAGHEPPAVVRD